MPPRRPRTRSVRRASLAYRERRARRLRRLAGLLAVLAITVVILLLSAFGSSPSGARVTGPAPPPAALVPTGPPHPQVIAVYGALRVDLPVQQALVTAIAYHASAARALALRPVGSRANDGLVQRVLDRLFGSRPSALSWYQLPGATGGPPTSALDVGAAAGSAVYAPVDGTIVAIDDYVLDGRRYGVRVDIQPSAAPALVVSLTRLRAAPKLAVGDAVVAARSKLGRVLDLSAVERQALARYTRDAGNHVTVEVRPARTPALG